jgi:hypothetical protein
MVWSGAARNGNDAGGQKSARLHVPEREADSVLNVGESTELGNDLENAIAKYNLSECHRGRISASAICGKVEAEPRNERRGRSRILGSYGLKKADWSA